MEEQESGDVTTADFAESESDRRDSTVDQFSNNVNDSKNPALHSNRNEGEILSKYGLNAFADVQYTMLEDGGVLALEPTEEFALVFSLLYALEAGNELSMRAFKLSSRAIQLNASNPTAWMYRRRLVKKLATSTTSLWEGELAFTASVLQMSRKNYQVWDHRRFCVQQVGQFQREVAFVDVVLEHDAKNYHAWAHRAWLVRNGIVKGELDATTWYIQADVRNNSAWNHRWLVGSKVGRDGEIEFACDIVALAPRNESAWNFLYALTKAGCDPSRPRTLAESCLRVDAGCIPARRFLVLTATDQQATEVVQHCELLAGGIDSVRRLYWSAQAGQARRTCVETELVNLQTEM